MQYTVKALVLKFLKLEYVRLNEWYGPITTHCNCWKVAL